MDTYIYFQGNALPCFINRFSVNFSPLNVMTYITFRSSSNFYNVTSEFGRCQNSADGYAITVTQIRHYVKPKRIHEFMYHPIVQCPWFFLSLKMREVSEETKGLSVSQPFRRSKGAVRWLVRQSLAFVTIRKGQIGRVSKAVQVHTWIPGEISKIKEQSATKITLGMRCSQVWRSLEKTDGQTK